MIFMINNLVKFCHSNGVPKMAAIEYETTILLEAAFSCSAYP
jgi:hypothetical protein